MNDNNRFSFNENAIKTLKNRIVEETEFPKVIPIENCSFCNLKCSMCHHRDLKRKKGFMPLELYKKIIDEIADNNLDTQIWMTFFGEGLILKDLDYRVKYAKDKGLTNVNFNSNGNFLSYEKSKSLIEAGLDRLIVGVDAINEETYKKIRVGGNLKNVTENVINYNLLLKEIGNKNQIIEVQFIEQPLNKQESQDFIQFWSVEHHISCKLRPMLTWSGTIESEAPNLKDNLLVERLPCYWSMAVCPILDNGDVPLCGCDIECSNNMGNVYNSTIKDIWNGKLKEIRQFQRNNMWSSMPSICDKCRDWQAAYCEHVN